MWWGIFFLHSGIWWKIWKVNMAQHGTLLPCSPHAWPGATITMWPWPAAVTRTRCESVTWSRGPLAPRLLGRSLTCATWSDDVNEIVEAPAGRPCPFKYEESRWQRTPDTRFPAGNSPIRGWVWEHIYPHGKLNGARFIPVESGGAGDGVQSPYLLPAEPRLALHRDTSDRPI
jgi:hypothetical protein